MDSDKVNQQDDGTVEDPSGATLIGANITAGNAGSYPGGIVAPAAEIAAEEATDEEGGGVDPLNLDALEPFANKRGASGDERVSEDQRELESDELNS